MLRMLSAIFPMLIFCLIDTSLSIYILCNTLHINSSQIVVYNILTHKDVRHNKNYQQFSRIYRHVYQFHIITYSMVQSPFWEANWFAASQEIPRISRKPKVHYRTLKRPSPVSILGQPSPVHIPTSHLLEIRLNIIHPSRPRSPKWSPSIRFPQQDPIHLSPHPYAQFHKTYSNILLSIHMSIISFIKIFFALCILFAFH